MTHSSDRTGSWRRRSSQGTSCSQPQASYKGKGFLDAQSGAPDDHDQAAEAPAVRSVARSTHDRDDLFDLRRIGRVAQTLVARRVAGGKARQRRGRSTSAGTIEQKLGHDPSWGSLNE